MTTSIHDLSQDLVEEILFRVPMTSLGEVRSTCKLWNTLPKDPSFKHCSKAEIMMVMLCDYEVCLMSVNLHNQDPFIKQSGKLKQVKVDEVFHCNGLLLCVTDEDDDNSRLLVWNPYLGQTRWIQPINIDSSPLAADTYCMGYDSNNNYKILRFSYGRSHSISCNIYDFKSNSWRVLDASIDWYIHGQGVSLKGNNYFVSQVNRYLSVVGGGTLKRHLICFDYTRERFWELPLPCHSCTGDFVDLSVVREEKLALLSRRFGASEMEIWITNKTEPNAVSWSFFLKVDKLPSTRFIYMHGSLLVDDKKKVATICELELGRKKRGSDYRACIVGEGGHYREVDLEVSVRNPLTCSLYVPSSVQI